MENNISNKKNNYLIGLWIVISALLLGLCSSYYVGIPLGFGMVLGLVTILFLPIKGIFKKHNIEITVYDCLISTFASLGGAFLIWYFLSVKLYLSVTGITVLFILALFLFLFPLLLLLHFYLDFIYNKKWESNKRNINILRLLFVVPFVILFFIVFLLQPFDIYLHNVDEIPISFWDTFGAMLYYVPFFFLLLYILFCLPVIILKVLGTVAASVVICIYLQLMFFNTKLGQLIGGDYVWRDHPIHTMINLVVWLLVFCSFIFLIWFKKKEKIAVFLDCIVLILLSVSLISMFVTTPGSALSKRDEKYYYYLDGSEQFTVGKKENVIFLIADAVDNSFIKEIYNKNPEFFDEFKDFTMYTDTCSVYDYTSYSVPQMLYGYTHKPGTDKMKPFMDRFAKQGYRFLMYAYPVLNVPGEPEKYIANYAYSEDVSRLMDINNKYVRSNYLRIVSFQLLPCIFKKMSKVSKVNFDLCLSIGEIDEFRFVEHNQEFDHSLVLTKNPYSEKCFIYQHIDGAHFPCDDCVVESEYCLTIFKKYLKQLKDLGVYDNSVIIIAADHGVHDGVEGYPFPTPATPMFMIKGKNEENTSINISNNPMYYQDIQATVIKYAGLYNQGDEILFGKTIDDYVDTETRTRVWFDSNMGSDKRKYTFRGNTEELELVVREGIYEKVDDFEFDFRDLEN